MKPKQDVNRKKDHSEFVKYYADQSKTSETLYRFKGIQDAVLRIYQKYGFSNKRHHGYQVADISCGAGTQSILWAQKGHKVFGIEINEGLLSIAQERAEEAGCQIIFNYGSAEAIPLEDSSIDICLVPELLEHVADWETCLDEFSRILKPGGVVFISTTNRFCPFQNEFTLPFYSWYPSKLKDYCVKLATSSKPHIVNYATYPAVNWFTYYQLKSELAKRNITCYDRLDAMNFESFSGIKKTVIQFLRKNKFNRLPMHIATRSTILFGIKKI